jgi:group II intron reverse transcriptase/maturase
MRTAETILNIIQDRGKRGLHLEDVYRQLFNPDLYLRAYGRIYSNDGAMTKGMTEETVDGMSMQKIQRIIEALRFERYQWTPVRRVNIPKRNGKTRPLGILTWSDKLLQEVMRSILEAYYEPQFSNSSHGFRPNRGCHTALITVRRLWSGTKWFIEGDIKGCFDNIDHEILLSIIRERVHDNRFLKLLEGLLKAGYCEQWNFNPTFSGTPQGGIISPLLANIYLNRLDQFIVGKLIPEFTRGSERRINPEYNRLNVRYNEKLRRQGWKATREMRELRRTLPTKLTDDPLFRRLSYVRYADDFLLGFKGPKDEAQQIKERIRTFLKESLKLELSEDKTLITHATDDAARFLGYEITNQFSRHTRKVNGRIALRIPADVVNAKCNRYMKKGKVVHRNELIWASDYEIVMRYQQEFRGYVQYYILAQNLSWLSKLQWFISSSMLRTLAAKHQTSIRTEQRKTKSIRHTSDGPRRCYQVTVEREGKKPLVSYFGGISLSYKKNAIIEDKPLQPIAFRPGPDILVRLAAELCELCGSEQNVEVHHIRKLKDLKLNGRKERPRWVRYMAARQRKTLVLCASCHDDLHAGKPLTRQTA